VRSRPGTVDDVAAVRALAPPGEITEQDARHFLSQWRTLLALDPTDRVIGATGLLPGHHTYTALAVDPEHREVGAELLAWLVEQSAHLQINIPADDVWLRELLERFEFRRQYPVWKMERSLADPPKASQLPAGLHIRKYDDTYLAEFVRCYSDVYVDQRFVEPYDPAAWPKMLSDGTFRTDLSLIAVHGNDIVGFVFACDDHGAVEIGPVGTRREWRGRGVSTALLTHAMAEYRAAGIDRATLLVDGESPTGAMRIYRNLGFETTEELLTYER
jgi:ribosomal protein S18 acetylase RimI-like enzyme